MQGAATAPVSPCSASACSLQPLQKPGLGSRTCLWGRRLRYAPSTACKSPEVLHAQSTEEPVKYSISAEYVGHPGVLLPPGTGSLQPLVGSLRPLVNAAAAAPALCWSGGGAGGAGLAHVSGGFLQTWRDVQGCGYHGLFNRVGTQERGQGNAPRLGTPRIPMLKSQPRSSPSLGNRHFASAVHALTTRFTFSALFTFLVSLVILWLILISCSRPIG